MHERIRRIVCRVAFFALVLTPVAGVLGFSAWRRSEIDDRLLRERLSRDLRAALHWEHSEHPSPGMVRITGMRLGDTEQGAAWLSADGATVAESDGKRTLTLESSVLTAVDLPRVWEALVSYDDARTLDAESVWQLAPCSVELRSTDGRVYGALNILNATSWCEDGERRLQVLWQPSVDGESKPLKFSIARRQASSSEASSVYRLETAERPLPMNVIAAIWPAWRAWGANTQFRGIVEVERSGGVWNARIQGVLAGIDLAAVVAGHTPQHLTGHAELRVRDARFERGLLTSLDAELLATGGEIGVPLLCFAASWMDCQLPNQLRAPAFTEKITYSELGVSIRLRQHRLRVTGRSTGAPLVTDAEGVALLDAPRHMEMPVTALVRALFPYEGVSVPATEDARRLVSWLALPGDQLRLLPDPRRPQNDLRTTDRQLGNTQ